MYRISIIGSNCISRCVFDTRNIRDWKEKFKLLSTTSQASIISVVAPRIICDQDEILRESGRNRGSLQLVEELNKDYLITLKNVRPDYLLLDFAADARYGVSRIDDSYIVAKDEFISLPSYEKLQPKQRLNVFENCEDFYGEWERSIGIFWNFIINTIPGAKVIVNGARAKKYYYDENGKLVDFFTPYDIRVVNSAWQKFDSFVCSNFDVNYIDYSECDYCLDMNHIFGQSSFHFNRVYYNFLYSRLCEICSGN